MQNFSDDDDEPARAEPRVPAPAKARTEGWNDDDSDPWLPVPAPAASVRAAPAPAPADDGRGSLFASCHRGGRHRYGDGDGYGDEEEEEEDFPGGFPAQIRIPGFGSSSGASPVGALRAKAKKEYDAAEKKYNEFLASASKVSKELRAAQAQINKLKEQAKKKKPAAKEGPAFAASEGRQVAAFGEDAVTMIQKIDERAGYLNTVAEGASRFSATARAEAPEIGGEPAKWTSELVGVEPKTASAERVADREFLLYVAPAAGVKLKYTDVDGAHVAIPTAEKPLWIVPAGAKFSVENSGRERAKFKVLNHPHALKG
jgi:hypothetical protein